MQEELDVGGAQCRESSMWVGLNAGRAQCGWGSMQRELDVGGAQCRALNVGGAQCRESLMWVVWFGEIRVGFM